MDATYLETSPLMIAVLGSMGLIGFCAMLTMVEARMQRVAEKVMPPPQTRKSQKFETMLAATLILANPLIIWGAVKAIGLA